MLGFAPGRRLTISTISQPSCSCLIWRRRGNRAFRRRARGRLAMRRRAASAAAPERQSLHVESIGVPGLWLSTIVAEKRRRLRNKRAGRLLRMMYGVAHEGCGEPAATFRDRALLAKRNDS